MRRPITLFVILALLSICSPGMALPVVDRVWECAQWDVSDMGPAHYSLVEDGCEVRISGEPYTLYSVIQFPDAARDLHEWEVTLESRLDSGAVGLAVGNTRTGLIFQVTDESVAEVLFYSQRWGVTPRLSRPVKVELEDLVLRVVYDIVNERFLFLVNGEEAFDITGGKVAGLPMTPNVNRVAVTTTIPDGKGKAFALHRRVGIKAL